MTLLPDATPHRILTLATPLGVAARIGDAADQGGRVVVALVDRRQARFFCRDGGAVAPAGVLRVVPPTSRGDAMPLACDECTRRFARLVSARLAVLAAGDARIVLDGAPDVVRAVRDALPAALTARLPDAP